MNRNTVNKFLFALANPIHDDTAIDKFIEKFKRPPRTDNDDWIEVKSLLPSTGLTTADDDYDLKSFRAKKAIIDYWKAKRLEKTT